jgi:ubiquinone/menaquinone biosynthesis C-methylase UbiE
MSTSHFDDIATAYDQSLPAHVVEHYLSKRTRFVLEHCPLGQVLEVGCGTGLLAAQLAGAGYDVTGVDPSEGMLEVLRARTSEVETVHGSGTALPFPDDTFDLVLSVAVMHHIADPGEVHRALAEMVRVTKPSGRILVWDHNPRNPYWKNLMARVPQDTGDERLIGEHELVTGLEESGAEILASAQLGLVPDFTPERALVLAAAAERAAERIPLLRRFCAHNVILAAKRDLRRPTGPTQ